MGVLLREVLPKATTLYLSGPLQVRGLLLCLLCVCAAAACGCSCRWCFQCLAGARLPACRACLCALRACALQAPSDESDEDDFALVSHGVVAGSSVDDLPSHVQAVVAALKHNQAQLDELAAAQAARAREAAKAGTAVKRRLAERRRALLLPSGAAETAVERFWLRVLRATDAGALAISSRDAAVLAQLADVRFSLSGGGGSGGELHGKREWPADGRATAAGAARHSTLLWLHACASVCCLCVAMSDMRAPACCHHACHQLSWSSCQAASTWRRPAACCPRRTRLTLSRQPGSRACWPRA